MTTIPGANASPTTGKRFLLKSGGEGTIFVQGDKALKLYHQPTPQRRDKLQAFLARGFSRLLPSGAMAPRRLIRDGDGRVTGFEMALLPETAHPWKKLTQFNFCKQQGLDLETELALLLAAHRDLQTIHAAGLVVGDLNDHNLFVDWPAAQAGPSSPQDHLYWIDVDSYQFDRFPCPVALLSFLDPRLYHVPNFAVKPVFSPESDWYAFAVLIYKTLLKTHPYGGVHPQHKTLQARAKARISVLHPSVTYPKAARPPTVLDDAMLAHLRRVFEEGQRQTVPASLLQTLKDTLRRCPRCDERYAASRPRCPTCKKQSPRVQAATVSGALHLRRLLHTPALICNLFVQPSGGIIAVTREDGAYRLLRLGPQGPVDEAPLFSGPPGARFALFQDILVVNPPGRRDLLLIKVENGAPQRLASTNSERFDGETVFAATPSALYRLANGYVIRAQVRRDQLLEDVVGTAHRHRTKLWASPHGDLVAGVHRLFDRHHFFMLDEGVCERPLASGQANAGTISAIDVAWGPRRVAFLWQQVRRGKVINLVQIYDVHGRLKHENKIDAAPPSDRLDGKLVAGNTLLHPTDRGVLKEKPQSQTLLGDLATCCSSKATLHWHPRGLLIQDESSIFLAET